MWERAGPVQMFVYIDFALAVNRRACGGTSISESSCLSANESWK